MSHREEKKEVNYHQIDFFYLERKEEINEGKLNATETNWRRKHPLMRE